MALKPTNQLTCTNSSRVLPQMLIVAQLVKDFPVIYGAKKLILVFKRVRHWLRHYATSRRIECSNPDEVIGFFN
jgi:hypothetical protein